MRGAALGRNLLWKWWYPLLTRLTRERGVAFLNYGYDDPEAPRLALAPAEEPHRACIQLYERLATLTPLAGLRVLEVSCGHGGGAEYLARRHGPAKVDALDRNPAAVAWCKKRYTLPNLAFVAGNALALPFGDATFDAVLNVEASHCYPDFARFVSEVQRVLKPGGHFLFTDFRDQPDVAALDARLQESGLTVTLRDDISARVLRGMAMNTPHYRALIEQLLPQPLHRMAARFAGTEGSPIHQALRTGESHYLLYHLRKAAASTG